MTLLKVSLVAPPREVSSIYYVVLILKVQGSLQQHVEVPAAEWEKGDTEVQGRSWRGWSEKYVHYSQSYPVNQVSSIGPSYLPEKPEVVFPL